MRSGWAGCGVFRDCCQPLPDVGVTHAPHAPHAPCSCVRAPVLVSHTLAHIRTLPVHCVRCVHPVRPVRAFAACACTGDETCDAWRPSSAFRYSPLAFLNFWKHLTTGASCRIFVLHTGVDAEGFIHKSFRGVVSVSCRNGIFQDK